MGSINNKEIMAKNINTLLERSGKSRTQVCDDLNISYTTFSDWVNGKTYPRIDKIELMANYFKVKKSDLVEEQVDESVEYEWISRNAKDLDEDQLKKLKALMKITFDELRDKL